MEKLNLLASEYLISNTQELANLHKHYLHLNTDISDDINVINELSKDLKIKYLLKMLSKFNELAVTTNKFEFIYYITSIYRKACESKRICMNRLIELEAKQLKKRLSDIKKKKYFLILNNEVFSKNHVKKNSRFRGVSRNKNKWQATIMPNKSIYLGSYITQEEAALVYDKYAIYMFKNKAITNFIYSEEEKLEILKLFNDSRNNN